MMLPKLGSWRRPLLKQIHQKPAVPAIFQLLALGFVLSVGSHQTDSVAMSIEERFDKSVIARAGIRSVWSGRALNRAAAESDENRSTRFQLHRYNRIPLSFSTGNRSEYSFVGTLGRLQFTEVPEGLTRQVVTTEWLPVGATRDITLTKPMFEFAGVGFPHIETNSRPDSEKDRPYKKLLVTVKGRDGQLQLIPNVACHGYSPAKTLAKASYYEKDIDKWATHYKVSRSLVKAVIAQESCFRNHAVSPVGARGLMQLMPETADWLGVKDQGNAQQNLRAGVKYLASLQKEFGDLDLMLAAYNAGPGNVRRYGGVPPFEETEGYVLKVKQFYQSFLWGERLAAAN